MVKAQYTAGRPVSGGPLFCAYRRHIRNQNLRYLLALLILGFAPAFTSAHASTDSPRIGSLTQCLGSALHQSEVVQIQSVTDGDTVRLTDGRRVRIIGLNAPELQKRSEKKLLAYAQLAKQRLENWISTADSVRLVPGAENYDRHGRTLAHVLINGEYSVAANLIAEGLAASSAVAPNTRCATAYRYLEDKARQHKRGLWSSDNNPWYTTQKPVQTIVGFHIAHAKVIDLSRTRTGWQLRLQNGIVVNAKSSRLAQSYANELIGKRIEIRGWFSRYKGTTQVRLHHTSNLAVLP